MTLRQNSHSLSVALLLANYISLKESCMSFIKPKILFLCVICCALNGLSFGLHASADLDQLLASNEVQDLYPQQHRVFGIPLVATERTPAKSVQHALMILQGYLDNDRDGLLIIKMWWRL